MDNVKPPLLCFAIMLVSALADASEASMATHCLMQKKREIGRTANAQGAEVHQHATGIAGDITRGHHGQAQNKPPSIQNKTPAMHTTNELLLSLPDSLLALGWELFGTERAFLDVVRNSVLATITHDGVELTVRISKQDDALKRLGEEGTFFSYDLDTMGEFRDSYTNMLNMLDIGGNYGVVTIAAFKKYPTSLRVVTVEPIPTTYFFLKWNLYLNGVPELREEEMATRWPPGVLALNRGTAATDGENLHLCFDPASSMNARICDCQLGDEHCTIVPSITMNNLMGMFGTESVAMVKMDCEGCEFQALPALDEPHLAHRVRRLAGELHIPDQQLEYIACRWDHGRLMTKCVFSDDGTSVACEVPLACM